MSVLELNSNCEDNNNIVKNLSRSGSAITVSGLDYGVVSSHGAPSPPPLPGLNPAITHFPANPSSFGVVHKNNGTSSNPNGEMLEKRRVSILNGSASIGKHSLSSNINIITSPDRPILPGVYK